MPRARVLLSASASASVAVVLLAALAGCAPDDRASLLEPEPTATVDGTPVPEPTVAPSFEPALSAVENQPYFDQVMRTLLLKEGKTSGKKVVNTLVDAGFDKRAIEVTFDKTAIDLDADNLQFAVQVNGGCIIGQFGNVKYSSTIAPVLGSGVCFIGKTRTIDW